MADMTPEDFVKSLRSCIAWDDSEMADLLVLHADDLADLIEQLTAENQRLRETLEEYGNEDCWANPWIKTGQPLDVNGKKRLFSYEDKSGYGCEHGYELAQRALKGE